MTVPRSVWISIAAVSAILLVVGTVWWLRARSVKNLIVLDVSQPSPVEPAPPVSSAPTSTSVTDAIKVSDEIVNRSVFFAPGPDTVLGSHVVYPSEGNLLPNAPASDQPVQPSLPALNPGSQDNDGDGLTNDQEAQLGTDPNKADTDGDGLSDGDEVKKYRTDPKKVDTDGDGYSDAQEIKNGYNPLGTGKCLTTGCAF